MTDSDLLEALSDLLEGMAAKWARLEKHKWQSWNDFVTDFREHYGDPHFQIRVQQEARVRTQGENEPVIDFITNYRHILKYLYPQPPLEDQVSMTYNNLKPIYRDKINRRSVRTFRDLELLGKEFEAALLAKREYKPPPPKEFSFLPELAFDPKKSAIPNEAGRGRQNSHNVSAMNETSSSKSIQRGKPRWNARRQQEGGNADTTPIGPDDKPDGGETRPKWKPRGGRPKADIKCFNCQGFGHWARECPSDKRPRSNPEHKPPAGMKMEKSGDREEKPSEN